MKQNSDNIYTVAWSEIVAGGASKNQTFEIRFPQRTAQVKRVTILSRFQDSVTSLIVPFDNSTTQRFSLTLAPSTNQRLSRMVIPTGGSATIQYNGTNLYFMEPGQWKFDNLYYTNEILCSLTMDNTAINNHNHSIIIMIETVEDLMK